MDKNETNQRNKIRLFIKRNLDSGMLMEDIEEKL